MSDLVIEVENLSKKYRLGTLNRKMLGQEIESWWARRMGKEDPHSYIHDGNRNIPLKAYDFWALNKINLKIYKGDVVGLMGRNGSGKSTLLKILSRITAPTQGTAMLKGRVASLLEVGTGFHHELTGRENVFLNGAILGMRRKEIEERYEDIVNFSEIEKFMETPVKRYSSGMRVRLAFAVAAHLSPDILILDEVLSVGDAKFQEKCLEKIEDTKANGTTVILVTHSAQSVLSLCNKGLVLEAGHLIANGTAREAVEHYIKTLHLENPEIHIVAEQLQKGPRHGEVLGAITQLLLNHLQGGSIIMNCPIQTSDGICQIDIGWISHTRRRTLQRSPVYSGAPEICVHIISTTRPFREIDHSLPRLFKCGAVENWVCDLNGNLAIHHTRGDGQRSQFFEAPLSLTLD